MEGYLELRDLRKGAIFETKSGVRAVKSEYFYDSEWPHKKETQYLCVLLTSGEYAHFPNGNNELVKALTLKQEE